MNNKKNKKIDAGTMPEARNINIFPGAFPSHIRELMDLEERYEEFLGIRQSGENKFYRTSKAPDYGSKLLVKSGRIDEIFSEKEEIHSEKRPLQEKRNIIPSASPKKKKNFFQIAKKEEAQIPKPADIPISFAALWKVESQPDHPAKQRKSKKDHIYSQKPKRKRRLTFNFFKKLSYATGAAAMIVSLGYGGFYIYQHTINLKGKVMGSSEEAFSQINSAISNLESRNFSSSAIDFENAYRNFSEASENLEGTSGFIIDLTRHVPVLSKASSGKELIEAGKKLSSAGKKMSETAEYLMDLRNPIKTQEASQLSFLAVFRELERNLVTVRDDMEAALGHIDKVNIEDLPEDKKEKFLKLKAELPNVIKAEEIFLENSHIFNELLGGNGPRKYLFLFQNNQEMRPTGGFIGSYGLLDIKDGRVRNFFIDGIFNPDGQFRDRVVPPKPIQKISVNWSLHDSNWWPDFPRSAEKAILLYEKTGGPTVDGIITITPTVMERMLEITGPVELPEYEVTLTSENFIAETQREVESDYNKEENRPKKILADLAPIVLDKIFNAEDWKKTLQAVNVISEGLGEKHILLYSADREVQSIISGQGWSGEILATKGDYLSVINTNINGYKTDGVIEESIDHQTEIGEDGTIIDQVTITRKHNGGRSDYEWWNKVNADYMRVYVPQNSQLISVEGQTREAVEPPVDYPALGFRTDPEIEAEEEKIVVDEKSGTRIYEDSGKTVFANWVYVSPQEEVKIRYTYRLPIRLEIGREEQAADSYSMLAQKQSGSSGSQFESRLIFPKKYEIIRKLPDGAVEEDGQLKAKAILKNDFLYGAVFKVSE